MLNRNGKIFTNDNVIKTLYMKVKGPILSLLITTLFISFQSCSKIDQGNIRGYEGPSKEAFLEVQVI